ncbi:lysine-specific histone demethylase 1 homolog 3-like [Spinacia oleracea]|uniref:Lysine-specific histone demethylase 1 homolog 3-like n=1 Tax=Spinacia oleracea TaxID=3562 RepID=A0ABM3QKB7_SPIOL|nr:lysine-specific histone demethylase 1 homolog 3-like [Spinacia oleracea]
MGDALRSSGGHPVMPRCTKVTFLRVVHQQLALEFWDAQTVQYTVHQQFSICSSTTIFDLGIGKTVKEKVCVHTSRGIRSIASQLVNMWIEVFRKEKTTNGGLKLLRHMKNSAYTCAAFCSWK